MGALADTPHSPAVRIQHALDELTSGNSLEYLRLQHILRGTNPSLLSPILRGLTHFAVKLHDDAPQRPLHSLFNAALQIDLPTVAADATARAATAAFLRNLVSADASFIEPVLRLIARAFLLPVESREALAEALYAVLEFVLATHARAGAVVAGVLRERYPHPVRPAEEHVPYLRGVLAVSRRCRAVSAALTNLAFEKVAGVEALVPREGSGEEAGKMEDVLLELLRHFDEARGKGYERVFDLAYEAFETLVVPCEARFTPYAIVYGAEVGGGGLVREVVERLRVRFFDRGVSARVREKFLEHCCGVVVRARSVGGGVVREFLRGMAEWLNGYIDGAVRRGQEGEVDVDVHRLFYSGFAGFVMVAVRRGVEEREICEMRVARIVGCGMRPLVMLDEAVCKEFLRVVGEGVLWDVARYRPSRTRFGARNVFEFGERLPDLHLPKARQRVDKVVSWDHPADARDGEVDVAMDVEEYM